MLTSEEKMYFNRMKTEGKIKTAFENADFRKKAKSLDTKKKEKQ